MQRNSNRGAGHPLPRICKRSLAAHFYARDSAIAIHWPALIFGGIPEMPLYRTLPSMVAPALCCMLAAMVMPARAAMPSAGRAGQAIEQVLLTQTAGLPGKVRITVDTQRLDALPPCEAPEAFLPPGVRPWGRISVGVRCNESPPWTRYVAAHIALVANYYVAARPIAAGQALTPADVAVREGDLSALPASVVVDPAQLSGVVASNRIASGVPIRRELLRGMVLVQQGQSIKLVTRGAGFVASAEGKAMTDAAAGAVVQVKIQGGQLLSGIVQPDGSVERNN
jgi:flagellar basal body P-ring formation protein FlgA